MAVHFVPPFYLNMELYIFENYRDIFPKLDGKRLTEALIKEALCEWGCPDAVISRSGKGKPYVKNHGGIYISASHSGSYFVCLIGNVPVGVDIQEYRKANTGAVGRRYFTREENEFISEKGSDGFFQLWTMKEAYAKYTGNGISDIIKKTSVFGRDDVEFFGFQIEKGMYCSCCMMKTEQTAEEAIRPQ